MVQNPYVGTLLWADDFILGQKLKMYLWWSQSSESSSLWANYLHMICEDLTSWSFVSNVCEYSTGCMHGKQVKELRVLPKSAFTGIETIQSSDPIVRGITFI